MDVIFGILLILAVVGFLFMRYFNTVRPIMDSAEDSNSTDTETVSTENPSPAVTPAPSRSTSAVTPSPLVLGSVKHSPRPTDYEALSSLPTIYYVLAIFCGVVLLIVTLVNAGDLNGAEIGGLIGYTVGAVLSMFAVGRVIELLQQIRDAVRNTPALSPGKPDDE